MSKKKTHEQYVAEVATINPNIEVVGEYVNNSTNILHRCKVDAYEWSPRPANVLSGNGCPKCAKLSVVQKRTKTHEQYAKEVEKIHPNIEVVGVYVNNHTKILHKCKTDSYEWNAIPRNILNGRGCPRCAGNERYGHDEYVCKVAEINPNIEIIERYIDAHKPILHRCKTCCHEWVAIPNNILRGTGCPNCAASKGEKMISSWLNANNISYKPQKRFDSCRDKYTLPFDFYLPDYNICIEYQGVQHYEPIGYFGGEETFEGTVRRDKIKEDYCKKNNIGLIRIKYDEDVCEVLSRTFELIMLNEAM